MSHVNPFFMPWKLVMHPKEIFDIILQCRSLAHLVIYLLTILMFGCFLMLGISFLASFFVSVVGGLATFTNARYEMITQCKKFIIDLSTDQYIIRPAHKIGRRQYACKFNRQSKRTVITIRRWKKLDFQSLFTWFSSWYAQFTSRFGTSTHTSR